MLETKVQVMRIRMRQITLSRAKLKTAFPKIYLDKKLMLECRSKIKMWIKQCEQSHLHK